MSYLKGLVLVYAITLTAPAHSETYDQCTDRAWEDFETCSAKCAANLACHLKCTESKNKDLKKCLENDTKAGNKKSQAISADCVERYVLGNALYLGLRCPTAHAITITWYNNNGTIDRRLRYNVARERKILWHGGGLNSLQVESIEPMQSILGGDAFDQVQINVQNGDVPVILYNNPTNHYIAFSFEIMYSTGAKLINNNVIAPGQTLPVYSGEGAHTHLGAQFEPD